MLEGARAGSCGAGPGAAPFGACSRAGGVGCTSLEANTSPPVFDGALEASASARGGGRHDLEAPPRGSTPGSRPGGACTQHQARLKEGGFESPSGRGAPRLGVHCESRENEVRERVKTAGGPECFYSDEKGGCEAATEMEGGVSRGEERRERVGLCGSVKNLSEPDAPSSASHRSVASQLSRPAHRLPPSIQTMRGLAPHESTHTHRAGQSRSLCPFRVRCRPRRVPRSLAVLGGPAALALPRMPSPHTARAHSTRR